MEKNLSDLKIFIYLMISLQTKAKWKNLVLSGMTLKFKFTYFHLKKKLQIEFQTCTAYPVLHFVMCQVPVASSKGNDPCYTFSIEKVY